MPKNPERLPVKKLLILLTAVLGNKTYAATTTTLATGLSAWSFGFDPLPWMFSTAGMIYMLIHTEPANEKSPAKIRAESFANGIVSLICGALGGPVTANALAEWSEKEYLNSPLLAAFMISAFWQIVADKAWPIAKFWLERKAGGVI